MPRLLHFFTLVLYLCVPASSAATDTILVGQALANNDKLVSKNGRYVLGFFETSSKSSEWYLGIWFNTVPTFTSAWVANRDKPIKNTTSLELTISQDGNLVIQNWSSKSIIWSTQANITTNSTTAVLLSSGNLILANSANSSEVLWQSFDHPTDTFFPGAKIGWDKVTGMPGRWARAFGLGRSFAASERDGLGSLEVLDRAEPGKLDRRELELARARPGPARLARWRARVRRHASRPWRCLEYEDKRGHGRGTGQGVRVDAQGPSGSGAASGGVRMQGERGVVPVLSRESDVDPALIGELGVLPVLPAARDVEHGTGAGHAPLPHAPFRRPRGCAPPSTAGAAAPPRVALEAGPTRQ